MNPLTFQQYLRQIEDLLATIRSKRPLNPGELKELRASLKVEFAYNSNAIEGNTLTLGETKILLQDGITIAGKTVREMTEALNHNAIFDWLYDMVDRKRKIDEEAALTLHRHVLKNIDDENAGRYRRVQVRISGEEMSPPNAAEVPHLMMELFAWYADHLEKSHPVELAAEFHYRFVKIHPFIDGNGRTVRTLMNIILLQHEYPLVIIPVVRRGEYIASLHSGRNKESFLLFFADTVLQNMKDYLRMIDPEAR